ncbi:metal-sensitive transcriptional regulator [Kitasatospora sp. NPDC054939]
MTTTQARTEPDHAPEPQAGADGHAHHGHGPHGYSAQKDAHLKRLRRIEGQIRGLQRMVDEDVYCIDVLTQVSASTKALQSFALSLLEEHLRHCVAAAADEGGAELEAKVAEATAAIGRLLRS